MAEVEGEGYGYESVGGEEAVDGEGAHPAVDVGAAGSVEGRPAAGRKARTAARMLASPGVSWVVLVWVRRAWARPWWAMSSRTREAAMTQARVAANMLMRTPMSMMGPRKGMPAWVLRVAEGVGGVAEGGGGVAEAEDFSVAGDDEEGAGEQRGLDDGAGDGAEGVAGFGAEGGGGLEAYEAEDGEHDAEADAARGHGLRGGAEGGRSGSRGGGEEWR